MSFHRSHNGKFHGSFIDDLNRSLIVGVFRITGIQDTNKGSFITIFLIDFSEGLDIVGTLQQFNTGHDGQSLRMQFHLDRLDFRGQLPMSCSTTALNRLGIHTGWDTASVTGTVRAATNGRGTTSVSIRAATATVRSKGITIGFSDITIIVRRRSISTTPRRGGGTHTPTVRGITASTTSHIIDAGLHGIFHGTGIANADRFIIPIVPTVATALQDADPIIQSILGIKVERGTGIVGTFPSFHIGIQGTPFTAQFQNGLTIIISTPTFGKGLTGPTLNVGSVSAIGGLFVPSMLVLRTPPGTGTASGMLTTVGRKTGIVIPTTTAKITRTVIIAITTTAVIIVITGGFPTRTASTNGGSPVGVIIAKTSATRTGIAIIVIFIRLTHVITVPTTGGITTRTHPRHARIKDTVGTSTFHCGSGTIPPRIQLRRSRSHEGRRGKRSKRSHARGSEGPHETLDETRAVRYHDDTVVVVVYPLFSAVAKE
mmetsp:Transcript_4172/g.8959  ORF Transcript_4172/g.8959 Transcript_4172/m.8959 type:complete len:485 (-) Transcript_4172:218-1672(-)